MTTVQASIIEWFKTCKPEPKEKDITTQIGVHLEEVEEMLTVLHNLSTNSYGNLVIGNAKVAMSTLAYYLKEGVSVIELDKLTPELEEELLDSILDQAVTGIGVATLMGQDYINGLVEVNRANYSKFDDTGKPVFLANGKIGKSANYVKPNLKPFLGQNK